SDYLAADGVMLAHAYLEIPHVPSVEPANPPPIVTGKFSWTPELLDILLRLDCRLGDGASGLRHLELARAAGVSLESVDVAALLRVHIMQKTFEEAFAHTGKIADGKLRLQMGLWVAAEAIAARPLPGAVTDEDRESVTRWTARVTDLLREGQAKGWNLNAVT